MAQVNRFHLGVICDVFGCAFGQHRAVNQDRDGVCKVKDQIQIRADFKTLSLGEKFKQSANKAENRRVTIFYILEQDIPREAEILGLKKETPIVEEAKPEIEYPEKLVFENPNGTKTEYKLDREFMKLVGNAKTGEKLKIDNLNFVINTFAIVQYLQYKKVGKWSDYIRGEKTYITLSLVAKSALAWQIFSGTLIS